MKKYLIQILIILLIFILHQSFILNLSPSLNFWPAVLVFCVFFFKPKIFLFWLTSFALLSDIYAPIFGINLTIIFLITAIIYLLKKNLLTNRSFISYVILILIAVILNNLFFALSIKLFSLQNLIHANMNTFFVQLLGNSLLSLILFIFTLRFTNLLHPSLFEE